MLSGNWELKGTFQQLCDQYSQDKAGFLWFATEEGLNKFDGTRFITYYKNETPNDYGITGNELNCLLDDSVDSILWIGTQRSGLNAYDYMNDTFTFYRHDEASPESISTDDVTNIVAAADGNLWVTTYWKGIEYFDKRQAAFLTIIRGLYLDWLAIMSGQLPMGAMASCT